MVSVTARRVRRVLIVDDEQKLAKLYALALKSELEPEDEVIVLSGAEDAIRLIEAGERFDVLFCDLAMPRMDGVEFCQRVKEVAPVMYERIVLMTGGAFTPRAVEFIERTSIPCLQKPFEFDELRQLVRAQLSRKELEQ